MKAVTSVDVEEPNILVPLSKEARAKLYEVSPSFTELKQYFEEGGGTEFAKHGDIDGEIEEGWLSWSIFAAVQEQGYGTDLVTLNNYFRRVTKEVNKAYSDGRLKKEDNPASILDEENLNTFWENLKKTYDFQIGMKNMNLNVPTSDIVDFPDQKLLHEREDVFREITGNISTNSKTYNYTADKIKFNTLKFILKVYEHLSKPLFIISLIIFAFGIIRLFVIKPRFGNYKEMIVLTSLLMLHFIRAFVIAYTETSMCSAINVMYLSSTYGLQFAFGILGIIFGIKWIMQFLKKKKLKIVSKRG